MKEGPVSYKLEDSLLCLEDHGAGPHESNVKAHLRQGGDPRPPTQLY